MEKHLDHNFKKSYTQFDPESFGLRKDFSLVSYASLKGWCSKVPQNKLNDYLKDIGDGTIGKETPDCSVYKVNNSDLCQISSCDFFYPLVKDPYLQGKIAVANVLSDIYAMGVSHIDNVLMILGISKAMNEKEREVITREMIKGFNEACFEGNTKVTGGQSVMNPWPMIGGTAISTVKESEIIYPNNIQDGDVLILTKPLGTQIAVNLMEWFDQNNEKYNKVKELGITDFDIKNIYDIGIESMSRLNLLAAKLMRKYESHGATDITGFGFYGHLKNLVEAQKRDLTFCIHTIPIIGFTDIINNKVNDYGLLKGYSAETSGGILLSLEKSKSKLFIEEMRLNGEDAWEVGYVKNSLSEKLKSVEIKDDIEIISIFKNEIPEKKSKF